MLFVPIRTHFSNALNWKAVVWKFVSQNKLFKCPNHFFTRCVFDLAILYSLFWQTECSNWVSLTKYKNHNILNKKLIVSHRLMQTKKCTVLHEGFVFLDMFYMNLISRCCSHWLISIKIAFHNDKTTKNNRFNPLL